MIFKQTNKLRLIWKLSKTAGAIIIVLSITTGCAIIKDNLNNNVTSSYPTFIGKNKIRINNKLDSINITPTNKILNKEKNIITTKKLKKKMYNLKENDLNKTSINNNRAHFSYPCRLKNGVFMKTSAECRTLSGIIMN
jgi:hypothetical protein